MIRPLALIAAIFPTAPLLAETHGPRDDEAIKVFTGLFGEACMGAFLEDNSLIEPPERYEVQSPLSWGDGETSAVVVWDFRCEVYAYNVSRVFMIATSDQGIMPVALARPTLRIEYDEEAEEPGAAESVLSRMEIDGWTTMLTPINARFDPETLQIEAHTYWRGLGDASDTGVWRLEDEGFRLIRFEVDPTYDGEVTPLTLIDYK